MANRGILWQILAGSVFLVAPALAEGPPTTPPMMPPPVKLLAPDAVLNGKERTSAAMAAHWREHNDKPVRGEDGTLLWPFGASLPSIVCAPLYECDLALQPGEVVNGIHAGDKVRWRLMPAVSGMGSTRTTHVSIKPVDAGLSTNLLIYTDRRTYSIKLVSTQSRWTPATAFTYPEDQAAAWEQYRQTVGVSARGSASGLTDAANVQPYSISGDKPDWRPVFAYTDGQKTYIRFPATMAYSEAPALLGLGDDGGWFHHASEHALRYRTAGSIWTVDGVQNRLELVSGVGSGQTKVMLERPK